MNYRNATLLACLYAVFVIAWAISGGLYVVAPMLEATP